MPTATEREIFIKASRGREILLKALEAFREYLRPETSPGSPEYYRARNLLKEGRAFSGDVVREAKKLLGPVPVYAPREYEEMRRRTLDENRVTVRGEDPESLKRQLGEDAFCPVHDVRRRDRRLSPRPLRGATLRQAEADEHQGADDDRQVVRVGRSWPYGPEGRSEETTGPSAGVSPRFGARAFRGPQLKACFNRSTTPRA